MNIAKANKYLNDYQRILKPNDHQEAFLIAICHVQLGEYVKAQQLFEKSCSAMFIPPMIWKITGQTNWLVNICVLSGRTDLYTSVWKELNLYQSDPRGNSSSALSSYSLMELLQPSGWDINQSIRGLLKKPKFKDMYAIGKALQAIVDRDSLALHNALRELLKVHEGMVKYGALRETAEGLLCMPAMSLAYVSCQRSLPINIESEYISNGYLDFLKERNAN